MAKIERIEAVEDLEPVVDMDDPEVRKTILEEEGFVFKGGRWMRPKAQRTSRIPYGADAQRNTQELVKAVCADLDDVLNRLLQVTNGKVQRNSKDLPLANIGEHGCEYVQSRMDSAFACVSKQLLAGRRSVASTIDSASIPL
jgi:hypothetical protein